MTMTEKIEFLERLRTEFPARDGDTFAEKPRCNVRDIVEHFNISSERAWEYIIELANDGLIDGGLLRFNNSLEEDIAELMLLNA